MAAEILPFDDSPEMRRRAAGFLAKRFSNQGAASEDVWLERMAHWWDANPSTAWHPARGWWIESDGAMSAFVGVIPTEYRLGAEPVAGLIGTSWVMDANCRADCIRMAMKFQRLGGDAVLIATTPSPEVRALLGKGGWTPNAAHERWIVPGWPLLRRFFLRAISTEPPGCRFTTDLAAVSQIRRSEPAVGVLGRARSLKILHWYVASPAREHHFAGWVDEKGVLSGYVIVASALVRGGRAWEVVESGPEGFDGRDLAGLVARLLDELPPRRWLVLNRLGNPLEPEWEGVRPVHRSSPERTLYFRTPSDMPATAKTWQMTEGDLGL